MSEKTVTAATPMAPHLRHAERVQAPRSPASPEAEIAIDVGGTFTDVVCAAAGELHSVKVSTTRDVVGGVLTGIDSVLRKTEGRRTDIARVVHGTTVATNAFIQRKGAVTLLVTTKGFEDVLEIGRLKRSEMYNLFCEAETPAFIAPGRRRIGVTERIDARGNVLRPLDEEELIALLDRAVREHEIASVGVCFLFSFLNPVHEQRTKSIINERYPRLKVSISSDIDPVIREYERTCVTIFDAYLRPVVEDYIRRLEIELRDAGVPGRLYIMQSRGGVTSGDSATQRAVQLLFSGPAAGVLGAREEALAAGFRDFISLDMGGTSCDVCVAPGGSLPISTERTIDRYPLRLPLVDLSTIGAGGGSIAWIDPGGAMRVGPMSAGADPGPACYGQGGERPTVTDASIVLGYLNPDYFAAGRVRLMPSLAERAIDTHLAKPLALDLHEAAWGIHRIVNGNMVDQVKLMSVQRGHDPRKFALVALGGAGPVHAGAIAAGLHIPTVIIPAAPGVLSAEGLLAADIEHDFSAHYLTGADAASAEGLKKTIEPLDAEVMRRMAVDRVERAFVRFERFAAMRYVGQRHELTVRFPNPVADDAIDRLVGEFHNVHERIYGYCSRDHAVEFVSLRSVGTFRFNRPPMRHRRLPGSSQVAALKGVRRCYFGRGGAYESTPVYARDRLSAGSAIAGPAIIEQDDTTIVVYPGQRALVGEAASLGIVTEPEEARHADA